MARRHDCYSWLKFEDINKLLEENKHIKGVCEIANDNADGQVIVSGDKEKVDQLKISLKEKNKIYSFKSERTFSLYTNEACS